MNRSEELLYSIDEASAASTMGRILALANGTKFKSAKGSLQFEFPTNKDKETFIQRCKKHKINAFPVDNAKEEFLVNVPLSLD